MHEHEAFGPKTVKFGVVVVSDAVYEGRREDLSGPKAKELIEKSGHTVSFFAHIPNNKEDVLNVLEEAIEANVDIVIFIGGTGLGPNDITVDTVAEVAEKEVPGFGELFRYVTFEEKGPLAILSRAGMWLYKARPVVVTPGSPHAVETALKLILPVARHLVVEARGLRHGVRKGV